MNDKDLQVCATDLADNIKLAVLVNDETLSSVAYTIENKVIEYVEEGYINSGAEEAAVLTQAFELLK